MCGGGWVVDKERYNSNINRRETEKEESQYVTHFVGGDLEYKRTIMICPPVFKTNVYFLTPLQVDGYFGGPGLLET